MWLERYKSLPVKEKNLTKIRAWEQIDILISTILTSEQNEVHLHNCIRESKEETLKAICENENIPHTDEIQYLLLTRNIIKPVKMQYYQEPDDSSDSEIEDEFGCK